MFSIVKNYKIFFSITIIFLLIGFGSIVTRGFNLGIDFTGGSIVDLTFENPVNVAQIRDVLKEHDMGNSCLLYTSVPNSIEIPIENPYGIEIGRKEVPIKVSERSISFKDILKDLHFVSGEKGEMVTFKGRGQGSGCLLYTSFTI